MKRLLNWLLFAVVLIALAVFASPGYAQCQPGQQCNAPNALSLNASQQLAALSGGGAAASASSSTSAPAAPAAPGFAMYQSYGAPAYAMQGYAMQGYTLQPSQIVVMLPGAFQPMQMTAGGVANAEGAVQAPPNLPAFQGQFYLAGLNAGGPATVAAAGGASAAASSSAQAPATPVNLGLAAAGGGCANGSCGGARGGLFARVLGRKSVSSARTVTRSRSR